MKKTHTVLAYIIPILIWALLLSLSSAEAVRITGKEGVKSIKEKAKSQKLVQRSSKKVEVDSEKKEGSEERYVTIDFDNVDIRLFIKFISELTGKNFVIDSAVKGNVTVISPTKITVEEAYKVFESVLEVHGYTTVPSGKVIKIVPSVKARGKSIETRLKESAISPEDKVVTRIIPLKYADPNELRRLFSPLISKSSVIVSYPPTRMLIVTDVQSNIKRLLKIVDAVDVEGVGAEISVIPLKYATATNLSRSLLQVFKTPTLKKRVKGLVPTPINIVPDERTNSLIVLASEDDTKKIKKLIELLDRQVPPGEGDIRVYYLQNADAEELAKVLMALPTKQAAKTKKGKAPLISKDIQIVPDKATNSLVIMAKKEDYKILEDVIKKLDIRRPMVYIEALIMEVRTSKEFSIGVQWRTFKKIGTLDDKEVYGVFGSTYGAGPEFQFGTGGFSFGVLGKTIEIKLGEGNNAKTIYFPSIAAVIKAFRQETGVNILSTPQILTLDNEEAEIKVGRTIPFVTRQEQTTTTGNVFSTYEYKDVGVNLKIKPQINQERYVKLEVFQEVTDVVQEMVKGQGENAPLILAPTTRKRAAKTTILVKDGQHIVIGGLIDESSNIGKSQVPCLGGIPGMGWFFKQKSGGGERSNLFIFLTPHIIETPEEAKKVYEEKRGSFYGLKGGEVKLYER